MLLFIMASHAERNDIFAYGEAHIGTLSCRVIGNQRFLETPRNIPGEFATKSVSNSPGLPTPFTPEPLITVPEKGEISNML
jgi:hypothetical protein